MCGHRWRRIESSKLTTFHQTSNPLKNMVELEFKKLGSVFRQKSRNSKRKPSFILHLPSVFWCHPNFFLIDTSYQTHIGRLINAGGLPIMCIVHCSTCSIFFLLRTLLQFQAQNRASAPTVTIIATIPAQIPSQTIRYKLHVRDLFQLYGTNGFGVYIAQLGHGLICFGGTDAHTRNRPIITNGQRSSQSVNWIYSSKH